MLVNANKGHFTMHGITPTRLSAPFWCQPQVQLIEELIAILEDEARQSFFLKYPMLVNFLRFVLSQIFSWYWCNHWEKESLARGKIWAGHCFCHATEAKLTTRNCNNFDVTENSLIPSKHAQALTHEMEW